MAMLFAIIPVSEVHLMEAMRIGSQRQRKDLANAFERISGGWFIASRQQRIRHEFNQALASAFNIPKTAMGQFAPFARTVLHSVGHYEQLASVMGRSSDYIRFVDSLIPPVEGLTSLLVDQNDTDRRLFVESACANANDLVGRIEARRAKSKNEPNDMRSRLYLYHLFLDNQDKLFAALDTLGKTKKDFECLSDRIKRELLTKVPCYDVEAALAVQIDKQWDRRLQRNDIYDIAALTGAIPYCDIVVTEKSWVRLASTAGLDKRYGTYFLSSILEIDTIIQEIKRPNIWLGKLGTATY